MNYAIETLENQLKLCMDLLCERVKVFGDTNFEKEKFDYFSYSEIHNLNQKIIELIEAIKQLNSNCL